VQHVVIRLADSLPATVLAKLELVDKIERFTRCDRILDSGGGSTALRAPETAKIVEDALLFFDGDRYALLAWCVMPNHVHAVIEPIGDQLLGQVIKSWKSYAAARINKALGRSGRLWAPDYFDRYMRSNEHLMTTIEYVENNPVAAGLCAGPADWPFSSASARGASEVRV
jgi:putative transposase